MRHCLRFICLTLFVCAVAFLPRSAHASPQSEFYIQQALNRYFVLPEDARTLAMSGSVRSSCESSTCIFFNPAGLGFLDRDEVSGAFGESSFEGEEFPSEDHIEQWQRDGYLTGAFGLGKAVQGSAPYGTIALGYTRYQGYTNDSRETRPDGHTRTLGYGYALTEKFGVGYTFAFFDDELQGDFFDLHSHARMLHLFGTQWKIQPDLVAGLVIRMGLGQSDTEDIRQLDGLSHAREHGFEIGVQKSWGEWLGAFGANYSRVSAPGNLDNASPGVVIGGSEEGHVYDIRVGIERAFTDNLNFRAGARWHAVPRYDFTRPDLQDLSGNWEAMYWTAGLGYVFSPGNDEQSQWRLDYGIEYSEAGDCWNQLLTVTWQGAKGA
jgi:hypothetical protein